MQTLLMGSSNASMTRLKSSELPADMQASCMPHATGRCNECTGVLCNNARHSEEQPLVDFNHRQHDQHGVVCSSVKTCLPYIYHAMQHMVLKMHLEVRCTPALQKHLRMCVALSLKEVKTAHKNASECSHHKLCFWVICVPIATVCCWQADLKTVVQLAIQKLLALACR